MPDDFEKNLLNTAARARAAIEVKASVDDLMEQAALLSAGFNSQAGVDYTLYAKAYLIALADCSHYAVSKATVDFLRGAAGSKNKTFMPSVAEVSSYCRGIDKAVINKIETIEWALRNKTPIS